LLRRPITLRALRLAATLFVVATAVFLMMRTSGDPALAIAGPDAEPAYLEQVRLKWGLDQPLHEQYLVFLGNAFRGDFGQSMASGEGAGALFLARLPATLQLGILSLIISFLGIPLGIIAALRQGTSLDRFVMSFAVMAFSMPNFFLGILFILVFSMHLHLLPSYGSGSWQHLVMPALTLGLSSAGAVARFARSCMLDVLGSTYVLSARARGIPTSRRMLLHALPNAAIPLVTILGFRIGDLVAGAIIVETVFAWPGIGRLLANAVASRDLPVVQVVVLATALTMILANLAVDALYGWLDPRMRR